MAPEVINAKGYIRTEIIDMIFILGSIFSTFINIFLVAWHLGSLSSTALLQVGIPLAVVCFGIYLNHKLQKTEIEVKQGQSSGEVEEKEPLILSTKNFLIYSEIFIKNYC